MTSILLRMARLLMWAQGVIRYEYFTQYGDVVRKRTWLRESDDLLDEIRQRMGR